MQKGICSSLCLHIHKPKFFPVLQKKAAILLHVVTSHLIPPRPLDQCCCPMHAGIRAEMVVPVFKAFQAKPCNNIESGERGHASFFAMSVTGWLFFLKIPVSYIYNIMLCNNNNNIYIISKFIYTYNVRLCYNVLYIRICYLLKYMCIH